MYGVCLSMGLSRLKRSNAKFPPILKLSDKQVYPWLLYHQAEVTKLNGETFEPKKSFFIRILYAIPSKYVLSLPSEA